MIHSHCFRHSPFINQLIYCLQIKWTDPDEEGLIKFLCGDRQFNEDRIRAGCKKILKTRTTSTQGRLDGFFKVLPSTPGANNKRKSDAMKKEPPSKKAKPGNKTPRRGPK